MKNKGFDKQIPQEILIKASFSITRKNEKQRIKSESLFWGILNEASYSITRENEK